MALHRGKVVRSRDKRRVLINTRLFNTILDNLYTAPMKSCTEGDDVSWLILFR